MKRVSPLVITGLIALLTACAEGFAQLDVEIPAGFTGLATIVVEDSTCPPISRRDGRRTIVVDANGRGCISEAYPTGWIIARYFYSGPRRVELPVSQHGRLSVWPWGVGTLVERGVVKRVDFSFSVDREPRSKAKQVDRHD